MGALPVSMYLAIAWPTSGGNASSSVAGSGAATGAGGGSCTGWASCQVTCGGGGGGGRFTQPTSETPPRKSPYVTQRRRVMVCVSFVRCTLELAQGREIDVRDENPKGT